MTLDAVITQPFGDLPLTAPEARHACPTLGAGWRENTKWGANGLTQYLSLALLAIGCLAPISSILADDVPEDLGDDNYFAYVISSFTCHDLITISQIPDANDQFAALFAVINTMIIIDTEEIHNYDLEYDYRDLLADVYYECNAEEEDSSIIRDLISGLMQDTLN